MPGRCLDKPETYIMTLISSWQRWALLLISSRLPAPIALLSNSGWKNFRKPNAPVYRNYSILPEYMFPGIRQLAELIPDALLRRLPETLLVCMRSDILSLPGLMLPDGLKALWTVCGSYVLPAANGHKNWQVSWN